MVGLRLSPLDRKLLRDLWRMRLHAVSIVLVLACGLAVFVMAVGMRESLQTTRARYYATHNMMDAAAAVVRAPARIVPTLASLEGVVTVETRVTGFALLDLPTMIEPATARLVSLPETGQPRVNRIALAAGRWPDPRREDEALASEAFAEANNLVPGDTITAVVQGRRRAITLVGLANSPEFIFVSAPGELFPQPERFGVLWMNQHALERAYRMQGAFNEAVFRLAPGIARERAMGVLQRILGPYGSTGAYGRDRMMSDRYLTEELRQLGTMAAFLPIFFLAIAAFLVNIALSRIIATERSNIGLLKAFGYADRDVGLHYAKSALLLAAGGGALGSLAGVAFGNSIAGLYRRYYHFPHLDFEASLPVFVAAFGAAFVAAGLGSVVAVRQAMRLAPAEALLPPRPTQFRAAKRGGTSFTDRLDAKTRIVARRILRFPRRSLSTTLGVALAIALLIVADSFPSVMNRMMSLHFNIANRQDVTVTFIEARSLGILHEVRRLPGVIAAEGFRADEVVFQNRGRRIRDAIIGLTPDAQLSRMIARSGAPQQPPASGIALSRSLAQRLDARVGDVIDVEQAAGRRIRASVRMNAIADPLIGSGAFMALDEQARLFRQAGQISGAYLTLDEAQYAAFNRRLRMTPALAGASFMRQAESAMRTNYEEGVGFMNTLYLAFAAVMAGGVAFSAARVTLSEQERDLATLRVLGFTRLEASYVLMAELFVLALFAVAPGAILGTGLGIWLMALFQTEMYSFSFVFHPAGYAFAIVFCLGCVLAAALVVQRSVDRLDMVGVLKARD